MAFPDIRQRAGLVFLAVAVGHIVLISAQVNSRSGIPLLQAAVFGAFSQVQRVAAGVLGAGQGLWANYVDLRHVRQDNAALRRELAEAQVALQRQRSQLQATGRLQQLLDLRERAGLSMTAAAVIAGSATPDFRAVTLDKGRRDKVRVDMAVLAPAGVIGRVVTVSQGNAKVQLLVDRNAAIAGVVERSRAQGIVFGTGDEWLRMDYLAASADVQPGDAIVSSGMDGVYPKGFPIGRVERVERSGPAIKSVVVRPRVDFGALEEVLVVLESPRAKGEGGQ
jgi:rod shape-determining protein MreC